MIVHMAFNTARIMEITFNIFTFNVYLPLQRFKSAMIILRIFTVIWNDLEININKNIQN